VKGKAFDSRQIYGAVLVVIAAVVVYAARDIYQSVRPAPSSLVPSVGEGSGIAVQIAGHEQYAGVYFLQRGSTISDLLREAGLDGLGFDPSRTLQSGERVVFDRAGRSVIVNRMSASDRLALGMPIDLNRATREELALIPGIGRSTAAKIARFREEKGLFPSIDELKRIQGLGRKQYEEMRKYLFISDASCS
jgi:competence protein ComEA